MKLKHLLKYIIGLLLLFATLSGCGNSESANKVSLADTPEDTTGVTWTEATSDANFSDRAAPAVTTYNDQMWIIGGYDGSTVLNDVWYSIDGITWTEATSDAAFSARAQHSVVTFNDVMWLIAGVNSSSSVLNDIWSSSDGTTWTQATASASFSARQKHHVLVYDNQLWLIGGEDASGDPLNDVWTSYDGTYWTQADSSADFSAREGSSAFVFNNKMWFTGGYDGTSIVYDSWYSTDGLTWTQGTDLDERLLGNLTVFGNYVFAVGGIDTSTDATPDTYYSQVWRSGNMASWSLLDSTADFTAQLPNLLEFDDKLWIIGGEGSSYLNEIWYTD